MPNDASALITVGNGALAAGDWPTARESFRAALELRTSPICDTLATPVPVELAIERLPAQREQQ